STPATSWPRPRTSSPRRCSGTRTSRRSSRRTSSPPRAPRPASSRPARRARCRPSASTPGRPRSTRSVTAPSRRSSPSRRTTSATRASSKPWRRSTARRPSPRSRPASPSSPPRPSTRRRARRPSTPRSADPGGGPARRGRHPSPNHPPTTADTERDVMTEYVAGIDLGSTGVKILLAGPAGDVHTVRQRPTPWRTGRGGRTTLTDADLLATVAGLLDEVAEALGPDARVAALAVSGMGETGFVTGSDGRPVAPAFAWFDRSGAEQAAAFPTALKEEYGGRTGVPWGVQVSAAK